MKATDCPMFPTGSLVTRHPEAQKRENSTTIPGFSAARGEAEIDKPLETRALRKERVGLQLGGMADANINGMIHKVSILPAMMVLLVAAIAAKVRAMIDAQIPMGYQDEGGFHNGVKPAAESDWPSLW